MATGVNYGYCADDFMMKYDKYRYALPQDYNGYTQTATIQQTAPSAYACTDGKDDGKLKPLDAIESIGTGVIKGAINGVKGMFFDSKGNFSIGKTLFTGAMAVGCFMCPALGALACTLGAGFGGVQLIKGIGNAMSADTDAEAKAAFENIGDGAATVIGCVTGTKASLKAVNGATSASAIDDVSKIIDNITDPLTKIDDMVKFLKNHGVNNADDILKGIDSSNIDDVVKAVQESGRTSAMNSLKEGATTLDKLKAFGSDIVSSTVNNSKKAWQMFKNNPFTDLFKARKAKKQAGVELEKANIEFEELKKNGWSEETYQAADDIKIKQDKLDAMNDAYKNKIDSLTSPIKNVLEAQSDVAKAQFNNIKAKITKTNVDDAAKTLNSAKNNLSDAIAETPFGKLTSKAKDTNTAKAFTELKTNDGFFKNLAKVIDKTTYKKIGNALSQDGLAVWKFLIDDKGDYAKAVQQFGYENVLEVIKVLNGYGLLSEDLV